MAGAEVEGRPEREPTRLRRISREVSQKFVEESRTAGGQFVAINWADVANETYSAAGLCQLKCPHSCLLLILVTMTIVYSADAIVYMVSAAPSETFSLSPMSKVPMQLLTLTTECLSAWACHWNATPGTTSWNWEGVPVLSARYSPDSECANYTTPLPDREVHGGLDGGMRHTMTVPMCFSDDPDEGVFLDIPGWTGEAAYGFMPGNFGSSSPALRVTISANGTDGAEGMRKILDVEPFQRKSVYLGVVSHTDNSDLMSFLLFKFGSSKPTTYTPYLADLFYDGKNLENSARLALQMKQFAEAFVLENSATLDQMLGEIGGFEGLLLMIFGLLAFVFSGLQLLAKGCPKKRAGARAAQAEEEMPEVAAV